MKGIILAGGMGTRLRPMTLITNKHLLPVYDRPMILYPISTLINSGIKDIMIICGKEHAGHFMNFLGSGENYHARFSYAIQDRNNGGIADALKCAENFSDENNIAMILGDNIFLDNFKKTIKKFKSGAMVFLKKVKDPNRFGVAEFDKNKQNIIKIEEKPKKPKSNYAQTGFYIFDKNVFKVLRTITPSSRGELEITDVVNDYIDKKKINFHIVENFWSDVGTLKSLTETSFWIYKNYHNK